MGRKSPQETLYTRTRRASARVGYGMEVRRHEHSRLLAAIEACSCPLAIRPGGWPLRHWGGEAPGGETGLHDGKVVKSGGDDRPEVRIGDLNEHVVDARHESAQACPCSAW